MADRNEYQKEDNEIVEWTAAQLTLGPTVPKPPAGFRPQTASQSN